MMTQEKDSYYEVLGVEPNASHNDILRAYGRSALRSHPDGTDKNSQENCLTTFQEIATAYKNLIPDNDYKHLDCNQLFLRLFEDVLLCKKPDIGVFLFFAAGQKHSSYEEMSMYIDDEEEEDAGEKEFDSFVQIIKNRRGKGKPVSEAFTDDKLAKLKDSLIQERETRKLDKAKKQSGKKSKQQPVPVCKPKQKSKKQLKAEQRRRDKEMQEIAHDLKEKAKVDQEKLEKRKQAEIKRLEEEKKKQEVEDKIRKEREAEKAVKEAEDRKRREILERENERQLGMEEEAERKKQQELKKKEKEKLKKKEAEAKKLAELKAKEAEQAKVQAAKRLQLQNTQLQQQQSRYPREVPPRFQQQQQKNQLKKEQQPKTTVQSQQPNEDKMEIEANSDFSVWNDSNGTGSQWNQVVVDGKDQEAWPAITRDLESVMMVDNDNDSITSGNNADNIGSNPNFDSNSKLNSMSNVPSQVNHIGADGSNDLSRGSGVLGSANSSTSANAMNFSDWSATSSSVSSTWGATSLSTSLNPGSVVSSGSKQGHEGAGELNNMSMNSGWGAIGSSANTPNVAHLRGFSSNDIGGNNTAQPNSLGSNSTLGGGGSWTAVVGGRGPQNPNLNGAQSGSMTQAATSTGNGPNLTFTQAAMHTNPASSQSTSGWGLSSDGQGLSSFSAGSGNRFPTGANQKSTNLAWNMPSSGFPGQSAMSIADKPGNLTADGAVNNITDAANGADSWQGSGTWSTTNTGKLSPSSSQNWGASNSNPGSANDWGKPHGATGNNPHGWGSNTHNKPANPNSNSNPSTPTIGQAWGGNPQANAWGNPTTPTQTSTSGGGWGASTTSAASTENSWAKTASKGLVQETRKDEPQPKKKKVPTATLR